MKRFLLGVALIACLSSVASADPYGTAGCGLGAMWFNDQPGPIQILPSITNNFYGIQTFSISSGTSKCKEGGDTASAMFIAVNQEALRTDISRGAGDSLATLSKLLKCSDADRLGTSLQKNYRSIFPTGSTSAVEVNDSIISTIRSDSNLSNDCAAVI